MADRRASYPDLEKAVPACARRGSALFLHVAPPSGYPTRYRESASLRAYGASELQADELRSALKATSKRRRPHFGILSRQNFAEYGRA